MARYSPFVCLLLALLLVTSHGGVKTAVEGASLDQQCVSLWDCGEGAESCKAKCASSFHGVGVCGEAAAPSMCTCTYTC
ncbi:hypothetical protein LINGRAPRIM_LOCUS2938 [Linum grandiflorum]